MNIEIDLTWVAKREYIKKHQDDKEPRIYLADGIPAGKERHKKHNALFVGKNNQEIITRAFLPNIFQTQNSIVVFEDGHRMYDTCRQTLREKGYHIRYFAPGNQDASDKYNPFFDMRGLDGKICEEAVTEFCRELIGIIINEQALISDLFMEKATRAFLKALVFYVLEFNSERKQTFEDMLSLMEEGVESLYERMTKVTNSAAYNHWAVFMLAPKTMQEPILACSSAILGDFNKKYGKIINAKKHESPVYVYNIWDQKKALFIDTRILNNTDSFFIRYIWKRISLRDCEIPVRSSVTVFVDDILQDEYDEMFFTTPASYMFVTYLFACSSVIKKFPKQIDNQDNIIFFNNDWKEEAAAAMKHFHGTLETGGVRINADKCVVLPGDCDGFTAKKMPPVHLVTTNDIRKPENELYCEWDSDTEK